MTTKTADTLSIPIKSTNVRSHVVAPVWIRAGFSTASRVAPDLTAAVAERCSSRPGGQPLAAVSATCFEGGAPLEIAGMKAWSWGEGPIVLLVHGWNGRATQLGDFVAPLVERGYRVVAYEHLATATRREPEYRFPNWRLAFERSPTRSAASTA